MIFLQILKGCFLFLLAFFLILCFTPIGIHITSKSDGYQIRLKLWCFSFSLLSQKKEQKEKEVKKNKSRNAKTPSQRKASSHKKTSPKKTKTKTKKPSTAQKKKPKPSDTPSALEETFSMIQKFLPLFIVSMEGLATKKRIHKLNLELVIGSSDPVEAVALYGQAHALLGTIWIPLDHALNLEEGRARVLLEFEEITPAIYGEFLLTITIGQLLNVFARLAYGWCYKTNSMKTSSKSKNKKKPQ